MFWANIIPANTAEEAELRRNGSIIDAPRSALYLGAVTSLLGVDLGFIQSAERGSGLWGDGSPIPLMSYSLIEYLMGVNLSTFDLLELGGGNSTQFWAPRVKSVVTLDTDLSYIDTLRKSVPANVSLRHSAPEALAANMRALDRKFDVIAIDPAANRYACAKAALELLKPGGFILLDNSDWFPNTTKLLRDADLIEIDFPDFRPVHHYRCVTSLFLHPDFRAFPLSGQMPEMPVGGKNQGPFNNWDDVID